MLALLVSLFSFLAFRADAALLTSQKAAEAWRGESGERFAQISVFMPESSGLTQDSVRQLRESLDKRFISEAMSPPEGGSLYCDAYYASVGSVSAVGDYAKAQVELCGVGGDFFLFHPLELISGGYISEGDIMQDRAVLDENAAWRLFGASNIAGRTVTVEDRDFFVAGVVKCESDRYTERADSGGARIYMSFSALSEMHSGLSAECYEAVLPNPVKGFAMQMLTELFPVQGGETVENSGRYGLLQLYDVLKGFSERTMRKNSIELPYWENAARLSENHAARLLPLMLLPLLLPTAFIACLAVVGVKQVSGRVRARIKKYSEFG